MSMSPKIIKTRYVSSASSGGGRIRATHLATGESMTIHYPHELPREERHKAAAKALAERSGWLVHPHSWDCEESGDGSCYFILNWE